MTFFFKPSRGIYNLIVNILVFIATVGYSKPLGIIIPINSSPVNPIIHIDL